jgi:hypothetical protein
VFALPLAEGAVGAIALAEIGRQEVHRADAELLQLHADDAAAVRDSAALDRLPDDKRRQWRQLWDDVAALLRKAEATK